MLNNIFQSVVGLLFFTLDSCFLYSASANRWFNECKNLRNPNCKPQNKTIKQTTNSSINSSKTKANPKKLTIKQLIAREVLIGFAAVVLYIILKEVFYYEDYALLIIIILYTVLVSLILVRWAWIVYLGK